MSPNGPCPENKPEGPTFFAKVVLDAELDQIAARRNGLFEIVPSSPAQPAESSDGYERAHQIRPLGMALSGGGIRSATFNLGILQGLSEMNLLQHIDYLSTVSGGGYIGTWLHAVIQRKHAGRPDRAASRLLSPKDNPVPGEAGRDPISWLREYSNYLAPEAGLFSNNFWAIGMIRLRNIGLNQLILVPFLASVLLLAILAGVLQQHALQNRSVLYGDLIGAVILLLIATFTVGVNMRRTAARELGSEATDLPRWTAAACSLSLLVGSFLLSCLHSHFDFPVRGGGAALGLFLLFFLFQWVSGFANVYIKRRPNASPLQALLLFHFLWIPLVCASATGSLLWGLSELFGMWDNAASQGGPGPWYLMPDMRCARER